MSDEDAELPPYDYGLLTPAQVAEIERRWPRIEPLWIAGAIDGYVVDSDIPRQTASEIQRYLADIRQDALRLLRKISSLEHSSSFWLWHADFGDPKSLRKRLKMNLDALVERASAAIAEAPASSAKRSPFEILGRDIANIVEQAGYPVTASVNGPFVGLIAIAFDAIGIDAGARSVAQSYLRNFEK